MLLRAMMILMLAGGAVQAQETMVQGAGVKGAGKPAMLPGLPDPAKKKLRAAPDTFLQDAAAVIYGYGANGSIDLAGIDTFIAAERAKVRAREMARYLAADLNNDGDLGRAEMALLADAAPAAKRGRLQRGYDQADADANGLLTTVELRGFAQTLALAQLTEADAQALRALLLFDQDGNGLVAMEEVAIGVRALVDGA